MASYFTRSIGAEPGVQLNPLVDSSALPSASDSDQRFGIVMRATRGRIDRPFLVTASDVYDKLGAGEQIRVNALNTAWVHVVEALNNGAQAAVVQRITTDSAKVKYLVITKQTASEEGETATGFDFAVAEELPSDYFVAVKHLECFNDGIIVSIHADELTEGGVNVANSALQIRLADPDGNVLYSYEGSLVAGTVDDYGNSYYLPDVVAKNTDALEVYVGATGDDAQIETTSDAYGYSDSGTAQWVDSGVQVCFEEGGTDYTTAQYQAAAKSLVSSESAFTYVSSGGSESVALLSALMDVCEEENLILKFDIPGSLTPDEAITFLNSTGLTSRGEYAHLAQAFWSPIKSDDPTGKNGYGIYGVATLNIAMSCARNASKDANGFAQKRQPIAGKNYPIARTNMRLAYTTKKPEPSRLAKACINPCGYEVYSSGGQFVFVDSLTCAATTNSLRKLAAVADMSVAVDEAVCRYGHDVLQTPMVDAIDAMEKYLEKYFENATTAKWLVTSEDDQMNGEAWRFTVSKSAEKPYDKLIVKYWLHYDGTARQIEVTQTITK